MTELPERRWSQNPALSELSRHTLEEFELELERRQPAGTDVPDPVVAEIFSGACWRELAAARDNLARARERYDTSILKARTAGFSWGEIGEVLGVSRQQLHRRFNTQKQGGP
jgi:hypothetical protein